MLRFQWDSLRRGDRLLVHDAATPHLGLRPAEVVCLDTTPTGYDVGVRYTDGADAGTVVRPGRFAVHFDPISDESACWRCEELPLAG